MRVLCRLIDELLKERAIVLLQLDPDFIASEEGQCERRMILSNWLKKGEKENLLCKEINR